MTVVSAHGKTQREFGEALSASLWAQDLTPRTAMVHAGEAVYANLVMREPDGPRTRLPGVGHIGIVLDLTLDEWSACIRAKEGA